MAVYNKQQRIDADCFYPIASVLPYAGQTAPDGWLLCDGSEYSSTAEDGKYKELYDVIGTLYGVGSASDSFKVPDCRKRFIEGASANYGIGQKIDAQIPAHSHSFTGTAVTSSSSGSHTHGRGDMNVAANGMMPAYGYGNVDSTWHGCVRFSSGYNNNTGGLGSGSSCHYGEMQFDASKGWSGSSSSVGDHSHTFTAKGTLDNASAHNSVYGKSDTVQPAAICLNYIIRYK